MSAEQETGLAAKYLQSIEYEISTYNSQYLKMPSAVVVSADVARSINVQTVKGVPVRMFDQALPGTILVGRYARTK